MAVIERIWEIHAELAELRRDIHAHPETAFAEQRTSDIVARKLESFGIEAHRGLAKTGVVGRLRAGDSARAIGLRADMDALPIHELNTFAHRSRNDGRMHACGHDGHTAMLLGAARYLAETRNFDGIVNFIFQPAEEGEGGGRAMVEEGLFERFPVEAVFGMHNWPGMPVGRFGLRAGPMMASSDVFEIAVCGRGGHAALPHDGVDPIVAASAIVQALQTIVSRNVNPVDAGVVSVTQFNGGETWNVIPDEVVLRGTTRAFRPATQDLLEARLREIAEGVAPAHGARARVHYERRYPPTVNSAREAELCARVLEAMAGPENVERDIDPVMGAEDFAFMLQAKPGCYIFIGNGPGKGGCMLHNARYDFNDEILPIGASYWARLVEHTLAKP